VLHASYQMGDLAVRCLGFKIGGEEGGEGVVQGVV